MTPKEDKWEWRGEVEGVQQGFTQGVRREEKGDRESRWDWNIGKYGHKKWRKIEPHIKFHLASNYF